MTTESYLDRVKIMPSVNVKSHSPSVMRTLREKSFRHTGSAIDLSFRPNVAFQRITTCTYINTVTNRNITVTDFDFLFLGVFRSCYGVPVVTVSFGKVPRHVTARDFCVFISLNT
jgi:hypothetical protein